jgi:uncharacterized protein YecE (DUF72 family)
MALFVGTSGWSYKEWQPAVYPPGLATAEFLRHYATIFTACEINATHYRVPTPDAVARWADAVPDDFRFAVKAHRRLTDRPSLAWTDADVAFFHRFLEALAPLGNKLGPVLIQPADEQVRDDDALGTILGALPTNQQIVFELRHPSWHDSEVTTRITAAGAATCVTETDGHAPSDLPSGGPLYVRLRATYYDAAARSAWRDRLARAAQNRPAYMIARHEGLAPDDPHAGVAMARWVLTSVSNK